ncbi:hypothetical protein HYU14_04510 [Candidatus Woesearchaeota archaeon]|nr:hypothetical protein [Candidatus Woesearchaeota archaeon]
MGKANHLIVRCIFLLGVMLPLSYVVLGYGGGTPEEAPEITFGTDEWESFYTMNEYNWYHTHTSGLGKLKFGIKDIASGDDLDIYVYDWEADERLCYSDKGGNANEECIVDKGSNSNDWGFYIMVYPFEKSGAYATGTIYTRCEDKWLNEYRCSSSTRQRKKQKTDCNTAWEDYETCANGCSGGSCNSCSNDCSTSGATRCNGNNKETCGNYDGDSCLEWGNSQSCSRGCSNNVCNDCTQDSHCGTDGYICDGSTKKYRDYACSSNKCTSSDSNSYDCNNDDGNYCKTSTEREYRDYSCSGGSCSYSSSNGENCVNGCSGGSCNSCKSDGSSCSSNSQCCSSQCPAGTGRCFNKNTCSSSQCVSDYWGSCTDSGGLCCSGDSTPEQWYCRSDRNWAECTSNNHNACSKEGNFYCTKEGSAWKWRTCPDGCNSTLENCNPYITLYQAEDVSVADEQVKVNSYIKNTGGSMTSEWLIELQPRKVSDLLSYESPQKACDSSRPDNVHKTYKLNRDEALTLDLASTVPNAKYDIVMASTDGCCIGKDCTATAPYSWNTKLATKDVCYDKSDRCDNCTKKGIDQACDIENGQPCDGECDPPVGVYCAGGTKKCWNSKKCASNQCESYWWAECATEGEPCCDGAPIAGQHICKSEAGNVFVDCTESKHTACEQVGNYYCTGDGNVWRWRNCAKGCNGATGKCAPEIVEAQAADVSVAGDKIKVKSYLRNDGGDMNEEWLIEFQPKKTADIQYVDTSQETCDPNTPKNVHKDYKLSSGETATVELESQVENGVYDIRMVAYDQCCVGPTGNSNCQETTPYYDTDATSIIKRDVNVCVDRLGICDDCLNRDPGQSCDVANGAGCHRECKDNLECSGGIKKCWDPKNCNTNQCTSFWWGECYDQGELCCGNDPVPAQNFCNATKKFSYCTDSIHTPCDKKDSYFCSLEDGKWAWRACGFGCDSATGACKPNIIEYQAAEVAVDQNKITAKSHLKNTGAPMQSDWLVELEPVPVSGTASIQSIGPQETCDSSKPENVHRDYRLKRDEAGTISLSSTIKKKGKYYVKLLSTDSCCVGPTGNPDCKDTQPYGWEEIIGQVEILCDGNGRCDGKENAITCSMDCPVCKKDGRCDADYGETPQNCRTDCPCDFDSVCELNSGEDQYNCPSDCSIRCPFPDGSSDTCECDSDIDCASREDYYCNQVSGNDPCIKRQFTDECSNYNDYFCDGGDVYKCESDGKSYKKNRKDPCGTNQYCDESIVDGTGKCSVYPEHLDVWVDDAGVGVAVNKQVGDKFTVSIFAEKGATLSLSYDESAMASPCSKGSKSFSPGTTSCVFTIGADADERLYAVSIGGEVAYINIIGSPEYLIVTDSEKLRERFPHEERGVKAVLSQAYQNVKDNGIVYDLSKYKGEIEVAHPFGSLASYGETITLPSMRNNDYASSVAAFIKQRCGDCSQISILGDDFVVPHYRRDIPTWEKKFIFWDDIGTDHMYTDIPYSKSTLLKFSSYYEMFKIDGKYQGKDVLLILPDNINQTTKDQVERVKKALADKDYKPRFQTISGKDSYCVDERWFSSVRGKTLIIIGTEENNNAFNCMPFVSGEDKRDAIFIQPNVWDNNEYAIVINTDDETIITAFAKMIESRAIENLSSYEAYLFHVGVEVASYVALGVGVGAMIVFSGGTAAPAAFLIAAAALDTIADAGDVTDTCIINREGFLWCGGTLLLTAIPYVPSRPVKKIMRRLGDTQVNKGIFNMFEDVDDLITAYFRKLRKSPYIGEGAFERATSKSVNDNIFIAKGSKKYFINLNSQSEMDNLLRRIKFSPEQRVEFLRRLGKLVDGFSLREDSIKRIVFLPRSLSPFDGNLFKQGVYNVKTKFLHIVDDISPSMAISHVLPHEFSHAFIFEKLEKQFAEFIDFTRVSNPERAIHEFDEYITEITAKSFDPDYIAYAQTAVSPSKFLDFLDTHAVSGFLTQKNPDWISRQLAVVRSIVPSNTYDEIVLAFKKSDYKDYLDVEKISELAGEFHNARGVLDLPERENIMTAIAVKTEGLLG